MTKLICKIIAVFVVMVALIGTAHAMDTLDRGPKVGTKIPHTLATQDQHSKPQSFDSLKGRRGLVLIFSRSFDW